MGSKASAARPPACQCAWPAEEFFFDLMEKAFSKEKVTDFYRRHNEKRSGGAPGGKLDGKPIKNLRSEEALEDLKQNFPAEKEPFVQLLRNLREVHEICMKDLFGTRQSSEYKKKLEEFEMTRKF